VSGGGRDTERRRAPPTKAAVGEWDMCRNGKYTEHGIKERNGFGCERFRIEPHFLVKLSPSLEDVGVLMEPASILAKAWDHISHIGQRAKWAPKTLLVTGAGPIGLLAALMGQQRGLEVHVLDHVQEGLKPELVHDLGATYHTGSLANVKFCPDVMIECTGVASVIVEAIHHLGNDGILCLVGVSSHGRHETLDIGSINRTMVLEAMGREPGQDPYFRHYYRVGMDGKRWTSLTPETGDHSIQLSPSGRYLIDS